MDFSKLQYANKGYTMFKAIMNNHRLTQSDAMLYLMLTLEAKNIIVQGSIPEIARMFKRFSERTIRQSLRNLERNKYIEVSKPCKGIYKCKVISLYKLDEREFLS